MTSFDYDVAFRRNRGLVSAQEQERIRAARVLIVGAGGVGGLHAMALARLGIGKFRIVDPDTFNLVNFNRQAGATIATIGAPKASTTAAQIAAVNPDAEVEAFDALLDEGNVAGLLEGVDLVVDGIDAFSVSSRVIAYAASWERGIPVVSSGPLGMSATMHVFAPGGMSFQRYFDLQPEMDGIARLAAFIVGVAPRLSHRGYMDMSEVSVTDEYGPSLGASCMICAGIVAIESLRLLLGRPGVRPAPYFYQFDAYRQRLFRGYLLWGNRNPMQRIKRRIVERQLRRTLGAGPSKPHALPAAGEGDARG